MAKKFQQQPVSQFLEKTQIWWQKDTAQTGSLKHRLTLYSIKKQKSNYLNSSITHETAAD